MNDESPVLERLMAVIENRKADPSDRSYTSSLFQGGVEKIGGKILEEAQEVLDAAKAAYDTVLADTGCSETATAAARHAIAQAAYDETYKKTGCEKTSKTAFDKALQASAELELGDEKTAS